MNTAQKEEILVPLRDSYKQDVKYRELIAEYANNFKKRGFFFPDEFNLLVQRLRQHDIAFNQPLLAAARSGPRLTVELVPHTCWFSNVRDHVSREIWDRLRKATYRQAGNVCEICGGRGSRWPVECHEIWHYDDKKHIQMLVGLTALCPSCHAVKHIGLSGIRGKGKEVEAHLAQINGWSKQETVAYLKKVWHTWEVRSRYEVYPFWWTER